MTKTPRAPSSLPLLCGLALALCAVQASAAGDAARGAQAFNRCAVCHTVAAGAANRIGPNLHGLFERPAGKATNFHYSAALAGAKFSWTDARLDAWLADPAAMAPGTAMVLKTPDAGMRQDLIAYLHQATK